jgi:hypothetical protein
MSAKKFHSSTSTIKSEAVGFTETSVPISIITTWCHNSEGHYSDFNRSKTLEYHQV